MSTTALPGNVSSRNDAGQGSDQLSSSLRHGIELLASMKLTCVLFLLGMFVVFVGSLAQARHDVWKVVGQYFRTYVAWVDVADCFPPSMFPSWVDFDWNSLGIFRHLPFPGGWTIGWIMLANLLAAHSLRFRVRATGGRRMAGLGILVLGALLTVAVVITGNQQTGVEYGGTVLSPLKIWYLMLGVMGVAAVLPLGVAFVKTGMSRPERILMASIGIVLGGVLAYFVIGGEAARLNLSSMRILWQLLKGTACAVVMLIGCNLLFEKRGGVVLLHIGVALLMFSELQVGFYAKENMLSLKEGEASSFMRDTRARELAVIHRNGGQDHVVAIPESRLIAAAQETDAEDKVIDVEALPFRIRVDQFMQNSRLRAVLPDDERTSKGLGTFAAPVEIDPVTGMDDSHDMPAVTITLLDRKSGDKLESLLCAQDVNEMRSSPIAEQVTVSDTDYQFYLRFQRSYKDYSVRLLDVSRTNYVGSATPRDYRSQIVIKDGEDGPEEEFTLWMNNPLRYKGETFYQSGYTPLPDGSEMTTLSVVRNTGWMLPYIACMIVSVGMFAQFGQTLGRFLSRFERQSDVDPEDDDAVADNVLPAGIRKAPAKPDDTDNSRSQSSTRSIVVPVLLVAVFAGWMGSKARPPKEETGWKRTGLINRSPWGVVNLHGFSQLPVAWKGRVQPIDSFARTELLMASHKSTFVGELTAAELDYPDNRADLISAIQHYWPEAKTEALDGFSGEYTSWIERVSKLTSSGTDAVEERLRERMTIRMPAVRWFLDVVTRPELARRHRVIKIDNDQVLSLLGLEKRAGLAYSVEEIQKNLDELRPINKEGMKLRMNDQEHRMTQLQRRVASLFDTVGRVDSLQNIFLVRDSEGLLDSMVKAWWVLDRLGDSPAIMAVPTGSENEQRSWETLIAASALRNVKLEFKQAGVSSSEEVIEYIQNELPSTLVSRESLTESVKGSLAILQSVVKEAEGQANPEAVRKRAKDGAARIGDPMLQFVLKVIGESDAEATVEDMVASVTDEKMQDLAQERISADLFQVFEVLQQKKDKRLGEVLTRLQAITSDNKDEQIWRANLEIAGIALNDLGDRAGELIYGGKGGDVLDQGTESMISILDAWKNSDVKEFNSEVATYREYLAASSMPHMDAKVVSFEAFFNYFEPFMKAIYLYLPALVMSFLSWIVWPKTLRRSGFWLMALAFVVHTAALLMRMYISGRPPVTNLYSSAIFIGWAVVGAAFFIEPLLRNGIGNILGTSVGMGTLVVAHYLARDEGDTLGVMQAVLDTTFWLATHVVCITLGYAATFLAGGMAMAYCFMSRSGGVRGDKDLQQLGKMIYGVLCFAVFFSLVGTVLGGLWADDSWGRFWGWDPKENGAMLIVMWNALILHARWDKMVRDYGTSVLAMFGNIVTAWSWFGVNELKAGLHTYGFTEGRLLALLIFMGLQTVIILVALVPVISKSDRAKVDPA